MNLEEAIEQLKSLKKDMKKDTDDLEGIFGKDIQAIETVLQELKHLQKNNEELMNEYHKRVQERIDIEQELKDSISKDKIREIITKTEKHLKGISKRREKAKTPEEESVLWCLEIRLDERIRVLQDLEQRR